MTLRDAETGRLHLDSDALDLGNFDRKINYIGVSGGKDSTALLLWAVHESGYDKTSIIATFSDTGNECQETYEFVQMLSARVHPIQWIKPELDFYQLAKKKQRFPSSKARFCTTELKMIPARNYCYKLVEKGFDVLLHTGVRSAESAARAALPEREFDQWFGLNVYRPLLHWTIEDVWAIHARYGIPPNPLYAKGMSRVGCAPCIMSTKSELKTLSRHFPERINLVKEKEKEIGSTFFSPDKTPKIWRSKKVLTKDGRIVNVATIDDVLLWANTGKGGHQNALDIFGDEVETCSHTYGACE